MYGLDYYTDRFLNPYARLIKTKYAAIKNKYNINVYLFYGEFMYFSDVRQKIDYSHTNMDFDGDPPQDVLDYMKKVDEHENLKFSLQSLFRKLENNYSPFLADKLLGRIEEIPTLTAEEFMLNTDMVEMLQDIQNNNQEQMLLITKCNADRLLLRN